MKIVGPRLDRADECGAILRSLPMWFGIEKATLMYIEDTRRLDTFAVERDGRLVAFLTVREHFPAAAEVHCMAVAAAARRQGCGRLLLGHVQGWLAGRGVRFLQVKTVAATSPSAEYAQTRRFYEAMGFTPLEIFPDLWDPWNPALQYVKVLAAAAATPPARAEPPPPASAA
ncbi:MAG: GNAT family N-acetyltransferase [Burkholderiales bacterium]